MCQTRSSLFRAAAALFLVVTPVMAQARLLRNIFSDPTERGSLCREFTRLGNGVVFSATDQTGPALWHTDGTRVRLVKRFVAGLFGHGKPHNLTPFAGKVFFAASDGSHGTELWSTDGTAAGTRLVRDIDPKGFSSQPEELTASGGLLYFSARTNAHGKELWRSDGTLTGTRLVRDLGPGSTGSRPEQLCAFRGILLFRAMSGAAGRELWRSDGTSSGTRLVADLRPGGLDGMPENLFSLGGVAIFSAVIGGANVGTRVLFRTDGTATGTQAISKVTPVTRPLLLGRSAYFAGLDAASGVELYRTDGTRANIVRDIEPGPTGSEPQELVRAGSTLFFSARTSGSGRELWKSDGTSAGTRLVADISPGRGDGLDGGFDARTSLTAVPGTGHVVFQGNSQPPASARKGQLWTSNGTPLGTWRVQDLNPARSSRPEQFCFFLDARGESKIVFIADDGTHGFEPWIIDVTDFTAASYVPYGKSCAGSGVIEAACVHNNVSGGTLASFGQVTGRTYAIEAFTGPATRSYSGYELFTQSRTREPVEKVAIVWAASSTGAPSFPLASARMTIGAVPGFYRATFSRPITIEANKKFFVTIQGDDVFQPILTSGTTKGYYFRDGNRAWTRSSRSFPWCYRVLCVARNNAHPRLHGRGVPKLGASIDIQLLHARRNAAAILLLGFSDERSGPLPLPFDVGILGAPGCFQLASSEVQFVRVTDAQGFATLRLPIAGDPRFIDVRLFNQWLVLDKDANAFGIAYSNGGRALVGR